MTTRPYFFDGQHVAGLTMASRFLGPLGAIHQARIVYNRLESCDDPTRFMPMAWLYVVASEYYQATGSLFRSWLYRWRAKSFANSYLIAVGGLRGFSLDELYIYTRVMVLNKNWSEVERTATYGIERLEKSRDNHLRARFVAAHLLEPTTRYLAEVLSLASPETDLGPIDFASCDSETKIWIYRFYAELLKDKRPADAMAMLQLAGDEARKYYMDAYATVCGHKLSLIFQNSSQQGREIFIGWREVYRTSGQSRPYPSG